MHVRIRRVHGDRSHKRWPALPAIRKEPTPEIATFPRSPDCAPRAAEKREIEKDDRVRRTETNFSDIVRPEIAIQHPRLFLDKLLLNRDPLILRCRREASLPEDLVQLDDRNSQDGA